MSAPSSFDTLHTALEEAADRHEFAGVVAVRRGAEHMFEGAYGPASRRWPVPVELHTRFDTASVTKAFTAVAVLQQVEAGRLGLDQPTHELVDLAGTQIPVEVTIGHLLTHTSGIADDADEEAVEDYAGLWVDNDCYSVTETVDFLPQFVHKVPNFAPGEGCRYCIAGYLLAGLALEKVTGQGYREYVVEHVFGPATMRTAGFFDRRDPAHDVAEGWDPVRDADGRLITWRQNIFSYPPIGSPDGGNLRAAVRGADRRVAEDVLPPGDEPPVGVAHRVPALRDVVRRVPPVEEPRGAHRGRPEHVLDDVLAVALPGHLLQGKAGQQVPDVAVPAALAGREVGGLVHELRQEVDGLGHRVAGLVDPQRCVVLAGLLVGVVGDPRGVGQQVADGDLDRDLRAGKVDQLVDGLVEAQAAGLAPLQHGDRRERLGDRGGVEAGVQLHAHRPAARRRAVRGFEHVLRSTTDRHHAGELVAVGGFLERGVQGVERARCGHGPTLAAGGGLTRGNMSAMAMREIRVVGDPVLRTRFEPITERDSRVRSLVEDLLETVDAEGRPGGEPDRREPARIRLEHRRRAGLRAQPAAGRDVGRGVPGRRRGLPVSPRSVVPDQAGLVRAGGGGGPGRQGGRRRGNRADGACPAARVRPPGRDALPRPPRAVRAQEGDARDARAAHRELIRPPTAVRAGAPRA